MFIIMPIVRHSNYFIMICKGPDMDGREKRDWSTTVTLTEAFWLLFGSVGLTNAVARQEYEQTANTLGLVIPCKGL